MNSLANLALRPNSLGFHCFWIGTEEPAQRFWKISFGCLHHFFFQSRIIILDWVKKWRIQPNEKECFVSGYLCGVSSSRFKRQICQGMHFWHLFRILKSIFQLSNAFDITRILTKIEKKVRFPMLLAAEKSTVLTSLCTAVYDPKIAFILTCIWNSSSIINFHFGRIEKNLDVW